MGVRTGIRGIQWKTRYVHPTLAGRPSVAWHGVVRQKSVVLRLRKYRGTPRRWRHVVFFVLRAHREAPMKSASFGTIASARVKCNIATGYKILVDKTCPLWTWRCSEF